VSELYEEIVEGESLLRLPPGKRHELICERLHQQVSSCLAQVNTSKHLPRRSVVQIGPGTLIRPDLALLTTANSKMWLAVEVISSEDHRSDTVTKKMAYESANIPRLWMVDPRYDNIEVYHGSPYGLALRQILAGSEKLTESLLPGLSITVAELFATD
jgi:Uma2 family endonuclease